MKILLLNAYFQPEQIAYSHLENDLLTAFSDAGITTHVITPIPTRGVSKEVRYKYKKNRYEKLYNGRVFVTRFYAPIEKANYVFRMIRYLYCNIREFMIGIKDVDTDVVLAVSTPPTQGAMAAMIAKRISKKTGRKVPFVYHLQDIFPDSAVNIGMIEEKTFLWKIEHKMEEYTYKNAEKIIVISESFRENIKNKGVDEKKIVKISNWVDLDKIYPVHRDKNSLMQELEIDKSKFLIVYAGNMGEIQGVELILSAAKKMEDKQEIEFILFGGGSQYQQISKKSKELSNMKIFPLQPQDRVSDVYSLGNITLITCKPGIGNSGMPSKTWSILACNSYVVASFDQNSDLKDILELSGAGICIEPGSVDMLVDTLLQIYNDWKAKRFTKINPREYVINNASKEKCVDDFLTTVLNVVKARDIFI